MLGLLDETKTAENLMRHPECVVNLPAPELWRKVEKLAPLNGKNPVQQIKAKQFRFEADKFTAAEFTHLASELVQPARAGECSVHMEARVHRLHKNGRGQTRRAWRWYGGRGGNSSCACRKRINH
jgi:flavin reductase (DIM6/NTAB) family NADH-FMN oxidoreductase RutF